MAGTVWRTLLTLVRAGHAPTERAGARAVRRPRPARPRSSTSSTASHRPGPDFDGPVRPEYSPRRDGAPDPGEVVWTWVPYEEDPSRGKDRPALIVGHDGAWLLCLMLTSKDHAAPGTVRPEGAGHGGAAWLDIGVGPWDSLRRPSEVRVDRVLRIDPTSVRREGSVLPRHTFEQVTRAMAEHRA